MDCNLKCKKKKKKKKFVKQLCYVVDKYVKIKNGIISG